MGFIVMIPPKRRRQKKHEFLRRLGMQKRELDRLLRHLIVRLDGGGTVKEEFLAAELRGYRRNIDKLSHVDFLDILQLGIYNDRVFGYEDGGFFLKNPPKIIKPKKAAETKVTEKKLLPPKVVFFAQTWVKTWFKIFLEKLRKLICGRKGSGLLGHATITGLAAAILRCFDVTYPVAIVLASTTLMLIAQTSRESFCKMTDKEILEALEDADGAAPKEVSKPKQVKRKRK